MIQYTTAHYKRISKRKARRLYEQGQEIRIAPVKIHPENMWGHYADINKAEEVEGITDFETRTAAYIYYNCNAETGKYLAYYVKEIIYNTLPGITADKIINAH